MTLGKFFDDIGLFYKATGPYRKPEVLNKEQSDFLKSLSEDTVESFRDFYERYDALPAGEEKKLIDDMVDQEATDETIETALEIISFTCDDNFYGSTFNS